MQSIAEAIVKTVEEKRPVALATVIAVKGEVDTVVGRKMVLLGEDERQGSLGWEALDQWAAGEAARAVEQGKATSVTYSVGEARGGSSTTTAGSVEVFLDVFIPPPTLLICGAGHIAVPLARVGKLLDFEVVVLDDRASFANRERFPDADKVIAADFEMTLKDFPITPSTYVVLITRGHQHDVVSLRQVIHRPAAYVGMIGSRRRVWTVFKLLHDEGMPEELIRKVHAPIGIDLGAETPAEIAVSIVAEVVNIRRGGKTESLAERISEKYIRLLRRGEDLDLELPGGSNPCPS